MQLTKEQLISILKNPGKFSELEGYDAKWIAVDETGLISCFVNKPSVVKDINDYVWYDPNDRDDYVCLETNDLIDMFPEYTKERCTNFRELCFSIDDYVDPTTIVPLRQTMTKLCDEYKETLNSVNSKITELEKELKTLKTSRKVLIDNIADCNNILGTK